MPEDYSSIDPSNFVDNASRAFSGYTSKLPMDYPTDEKSRN